MNATSCSCGCGQPAYVKGWSQPCYRRWLRAGRPPSGPPPGMSAAERNRRAAASRRRPRAPQEREIRDPVVPYRWRARRYPWAIQVLERVEAELGRPDEEAA